MDCLNISRDSRALRHVQSMRARAVPGSELCGADLCPAAMSVEHRSITGSAPHVTKRLCTVVMFFIGVVCILGGFLLGRMAKNHVRKTNDIIPINLTTTAENLYKKARSLAPKAIHHNGPEKVTARLLELFHCSAAECGAVTIHNAADFVRNAITIEVHKLLRSIQNASAYLDSLR